MSELNRLNNSGNRTSQNSFLDVMLALKSNVMKSISVADVVVISEVGASIKARLLTNPDLTIECEKLDALDVRINDIMLVIFTDSDFRTSLSKFKKNQSLQKIDSNLRHTKNSGVLVGLIYRKQNEENNNDTKS